MHADAAHACFTTRARPADCWSCEQAEAICIQPPRAMRHNLGIEHAHCVTILGNELHARYVRLRQQEAVPHSDLHAGAVSLAGGKELRPRSEGTSCGSAAVVSFTRGSILVWKRSRNAGLPPDDLRANRRKCLETDFETRFQRELYRDAEHPHRGLDRHLASQQFVRLANNCARSRSIRPARRATAAGVITCMHAGMIPLVSYESGVDVATRFRCRVGGLLRRDDSAVLRSLSEKPASQLSSMARPPGNSLANHTKERFAAEYESRAPRRERDARPWQRPPASARAADRRPIARPPRNGWRRTAGRNATRCRAANARRPTDSGPTGSPTPARAAACPP